MFRMDSLHDHGKKLAFLSAEIDSRRETVHQSRLRYADAKERAERLMQGVKSPDELADHVSKEARAELVRLILRESRIFKARLALESARLELLEALETYGIRLDIVVLSAIQKVNLTFSHLKRLTYKCCKGERCVAVMGDGVYCVDPVEKGGLPTRREQDAMESGLYFKGDVPAFVPDRLFEASELNPVFAAVSSRESAVDEMIDACGQVGV
jgi:hypothetical protein